MPEEKKFTLDPNFDPRGPGLPDIPPEITNYKQSMRLKRQLVILGCGLLGLLLIALVVGWYIKRIGNEYHYIKFVSGYTASPMDESPGADLESVIIIKGEENFNAEKIAAASPEKDAAKILGAPDADYFSLGDKGNYIVVKVKPNLKERNITEFTINEITADNLFEPYDVFIGSSKNGPWDYLGQKAGAVKIDLTQYLK